MKQTLIWTALPNGIAPAAGGEKAYLRLAVFITPRLSAPESAHPTVAMFPDFVDWPTKIQNLKFTVHLEGAGDFPARRVAPAADPAPSDLWKALFASTLWVQSYQDPNVGNLTYISFPVTNILSRLREIYQTTAVESPLKPPLVGTQEAALLPATNALKDLAITPQQTLSLRTQTKGLKSFATPRYHSPVILRPGTGPVAPAPAAVPALAGVSPATLDFYLLQNFHAANTVKLTLPQRAQLVDQTDFHQIVTHLGQYPELLRRLGLVIDLEVDWAPAMAGATLVKVLPDFTSATPTALSTPRTAITLAAGKFVAAPRNADSDVADGQLKLNDPSRWEIGQIDLDGSALKTMDAARVTELHLAAHIARAAIRTHPMLPPAAVAGGPAPTPTPAPAPPPPSTQEAPLPALRSAGFWVARPDRAQIFQAAMQRVSADNLTVAKIAAVALTAPRAAPPADDVVEYADDLVRGYRPDVWDDTAQAWFSLCDRTGIYQFSALQKVLQIQDEGWISTSVTHPDGDPTQLSLHEILFRWENWSLAAPRPGQAIQGASDDLGTGSFGLDTSFTPTPGTLPRLRFGRSYRLRARVVDLAGNSLGLEEAGDAMATELDDYFRSEPLLAPAIFPHKSLENVPGESVQGLVIRSLNTAPSQDTVPAGVVTERHAAPPRTSEQMAELHGKFDTAAGKLAGDAATYNLIDQTDQTPAPFYDVPQMVLPYLPDPLAAGALIRLQPEPFAANPQEQSLQVPFDGNWPALRPFRLQLYEPQAAGAQLTWDANARVLRVPLAKADAATVLISSYYTGENLNLMEIWRWSTEQVIAPAAAKVNLTPAEHVQLHREVHSLATLPKWSARLNLSQPTVAKLQNLGQIAQEGRHWMLTPATTLTVLHATQQPLGTPQYTLLNADRAVGWTYADVNGEATVSGKSSAKFEIVGSWDETIDPLGEPQPRTIHGAHRVLEQHLERADTDVRFLGKHEFHDTKYRHVTYQVIATSRFRECFDFTDAEIAAGTVSITRMSQMDRDVLSTARPLAPSVLYVVPTFGWQQTRSATKVTSTRSGGGVRVYLERPWFSSGDGEQLGVVLMTPAGLGPTRFLGGAVLRPTAATPGYIAPFGGGSATEVPELLRPYVTQWGADPLWRAEALPKYLPTPDDFTLAKAKESGLTLDELGPQGPKVAVAGHAVGYDEARQLWYCDIELDPGSAYYPFLRLALARYQPMSVAGADGDVKLSRVVLADFVQLAPDRTAVLTRAGAQVNLSVTGPSYDQAALGRGPEDLAVVEVTLEENDPTLKGAVSWSPVPDAVYPLKAANSGAAGAHTWAGDLPLPAMVPGKHYRLVVREYEMYQADPKEPAVAETMVPEAHGRRLVYADALEIGGTPTPASDLGSTPPVARLGRPTL
jgi:hypothetical protein